MLETIEQTHGMTRMSADDAFQALCDFDELLELHTAIVSQKAVIEVIRIIKGDVTRFLVCETYLPDFATNPAEALAALNDPANDRITHAGSDQAGALAYARDVTENLHSVMPED